MTPATTPGRTAPATPVSATDVVVFLGPTLPVDVAAGVLPARYQPPAQHGDVFRAVQGGARVLVLIDGLFDTVLAVWHKEILWAMAEGVAVYGGASMGALRAAELEPFGMRGLGAVFDDYRSGRLEDDDEVAVAHAGPEDGWRALSEAMVDVRATLREAVDEGVAGPVAAGALEAAVKAQHYSVRSLQAATGATDAEQARLCRWAAHHPVRAKADDARLVLATVATDVADGCPTSRRDWTFQHTTFFEQARLELLAPSGEGASPADVAADGVPVDEDRLLDEVRLAGDFPVLADRAVTGVLVQQSMPGAAAPTTAWAHDDALEQWRRTEGLLTTESVDAWLARRGLGRPDLAWIARRLVGRQWVRSTHPGPYRRELLRTLRGGERFPSLQDRASRKARVTGPDGGSPSPGVPDGDALDRWFFSEVLDRPAPADLLPWCRAQGWEGVAQFRAALRREWRFRRDEAAL